MLIVIISAQPQELSVSFTDEPEKPKLPARDPRLKTDGAVVEPVKLPAPSVEQERQFLKQSSTESDNQQRAPIKITLKVKKKYRKRYSSPPTSPGMSDPSSDSTMTDGSSGHKKRKRQIEQMDHYRYVSELSDIGNK